MILPIFPFLLIEHIHQGKKAKLCRDAQDKSPCEASAADKSSFQAMESRVLFRERNVCHPDCFAAIGAIDDDEVGGVPSTGLTSQLLTGDTSKQR